ncbi:flagellar biosynthesis regulator FlhF [Caldibacillus thermoamylovorans]|uniref:Flagellar biosynthesis protein FlhF n=1 Tax=Caldibacillus thermoamylovorans TaxID=35841 RepID=A0A090J0Q9_9BACI|nr:MULTISPECIES: flagellar biosynthesis protein FlhF [Bacillaceae]MED3642550.1 flagellar biosynthesis protein FlhF [Caldifermentibacillus hisashii]PAC38091.1 flagellar biosynthesis protein FlhF [Caldifermentibacillus hisashii]CEE01410.1 flagellar biosynthesis regulator FlhF [Caldibacillus thermoamylovorans]
MKVKKYIAPNMPEAMKKIRKDLGKEAVILNSKIIYTGGFFGLFRKKNIEVIAALDNDMVQPSQIEKIDFSRVETNSEMKQKDMQSPQPVQNKTGENKEMILKEIHDVKQLIKQITSQGHSSSVHIPSPYREIYQKLLSQNISETILQQLTEDIYEHYYSKKEQVDKDNAYDFIVQSLVEYIKPLEFGAALQKKYIALIGPTGVGKTTTLAKIASIKSIEQKKKVAFITTDTYRIAAVEQLKTYAKILNVPIEVCYNLNDFKQAVEKFTAFDHVFIDTAGRNFRNKKHIEDLKKTIDFHTEMETYLVFSLTAKEEDLEMIYQQFSNIPIDKLIFTKLDETSCCGSLLNLSYKYHKPIAFITTGQDVPDDIIVATQHTIINQIVGETKND